MMNNIKKIRKEQRISVTELAAKLSMSQSNLTKIENGQIELKTDLAAKIAQTLSVSVQALLKNETQPCVNEVIELPLLNPETINLPKHTRLPIPAVLINGNMKAHTLYITEDDAMMPPAPRGTLVIVEQGGEQKLTDGAYIIQIENKLLFRRLQQRLDGFVNIISEHRVYPPQEISAEKLIIIGRVCGILSFRPF